MQCIQSTSQPSRGPSIVRQFPKPSALAQEPGKAYRLNCAQLQQPKIAHELYRSSHMYSDQQPCKWLACSASLQTKAWVLKTRSTAIHSWQDPAGPIMQTWIMLLVCRSGQACCLKRCVASRSNFLLFHAMTEGTVDWQPCARTTCVPALRSRKARIYRRACEAPARMHACVYCTGSACLTSLAIHSQLIRVGDEHPAGPIPVRETISKDGEASSRVVTTHDESLKSMATRRQGTASSLPDEQVSSRQH